MTIHHSDVPSVKLSWQRSGLQPKVFVLLTLFLCVGVGAYPVWDKTAAPREVSEIGAFVTGRVTHVRDGDTIQIGAMPIRLQNLDCAERGTVDGARATEYMTALVRHETLTCDLSSRKSYDRYVGGCQLSDGRDLVDVMIASETCTRAR